MLNLIKTQVKHKCIVAMHTYSNKVRCGIRFLARNFTLHAKVTVCELKEKKQQQQTPLIRGCAVNRTQPVQSLISWLLVCFVNLQLNSSIKESQGVGQLLNRQTGA